MLQQVVSTTGLVKLPKIPTDGTMTVQLSGATGLTFTLQGSIDGVTFSNKACIDEATELTIAGGATVSRADATVASYRMPALNQAAIGVNITGITGAVTISYESSVGICPEPSSAAVAAIPAVKPLTTINVTTGSLAAGVLTGALDVPVLSTNSTPGAQLVRSAAQMLADFSGATVGLTYKVRIINSGAGTLTLTTDGGATVTMTGTMTVPTNTWRDFTVTFTGAATATITSIGAGTI